MHICVYVAEWQHLAPNLISHLEILQRRKKQSMTWRNASLFSYVKRQGTFTFALSQLVVWCVQLCAHTQFIIIEDLENGMEGGLFLMLKKD